MKILVFILTTSLLAAKSDWKNHRACFSSIKDYEGKCHKINFNSDKRISKNNKITQIDSQMCKVSEFKYDFHFQFKKKAISIKDVDIRKFLHRDFKQTGHSHSISCIRKLNMHLGEFNRKAKVFYSCLSSQKDFTEVHIINNCREPGNYEFKFFKNKRLEFKGHTLFSRSFYEQILKDYTASHGEELDIEMSHIGHTKAHHFQTPQEKRKNQFYLFNPAPNFKRLQKENTCTVKDLSKIVPSSKLISKGKLRIERGNIPYNQFDKEVLKKSGYSKREEPLSYIRTPCNKDVNYQDQLKLQAPVGLKKYSTHSNDEDAWLKSDCQYIPYQFQTYKQLVTYNSAFSAFEVDGIYTGKSSNGGSKSNRKGSRWDASLFHLKNLSNYEIEKTKERLRNIKLINNVEGISLYIGNIDLKELKAEGQNFLMGIDPQKLVSKYNSTIFMDKRPLFAFAYDSKSKKILNQHDLKKVGFEKIWIKKRGKALIIDLVSHERITPVWRGIIKNAN